MPLLRQRRPLLMPLTVTSGETCTDKRGFIGLVHWFSVSLLCFGHGRYSCGYPLGYPLIVRHNISFRDCDPAAAMFQPPASSIHLLEIGLAS